VSEQMSLRRGRAVAQRLAVTKPACFKFFQRVLRTSVAAVGSTARSFFAGLREPSIPPSGFEHHGRHLVPAKTCSNWFDTIFIIPMLNTAM
jgi:hypothetical protein